MINVYFQKVKQKFACKLRASHISIRLIKGVNTFRFSSSFYQKKTCYFLSITQRIAIRNSRIEVEDREIEMIDQDEFHQSANQNGPSPGNCFLLFQIL